MEITFVRHTSVAVEPGICYGQTDVDVAPTFETEAERVRDNLSGHSFSRVFTSPLSRCVRLATFCGYPDAIRDDRLLEMNFGEWEMQRFDEIDDPRLQQWYDDYINVAPTGGESFVCQQNRIKEFLDCLNDMTADDEKILIFAHAGVITHAKVIAGTARADNAFASMPAFGELTTIHFPAPDSAGGMTARAAQ